jgi:hypothetical protein
VNTELHARAVCHRQFERLNEAAANTGDRLPFSGENIKVYARLLLEFCDSHDAPLQELLHLALHASEVRIALETFDADGMEIQ